MTQANTLDVSKIVKVYSGKAQACMCGCKGKWSHRAEGAERSIKIISNKIAKNPAAVYDAGAGCWYVQTKDRILAAYVSE